MRKRIVSIILMLSLLFQLLPTQVFSENVLSDPSPAETVESKGEAPKPVVIGELLDRRGESEKHFRLSDGTYLAVS